MSERYETRIVAFVDIMGFKEKVNKSVVDKEMAEKIHRALKQILYLKKRNAEDIRNGYNICDIRITTFSDSAVISYPFTSESGNLFQILLDLIYLQIDLLQNDVLLRGGITIGKVFHDGEIVYGPAMNEAYRLESQVAIYPRIIIDQEVLLKGITKTYCSHHDIETECEFIERLIRKDKKTGLWYLDYLSQCDELDYPEIDYYDMLESIRKVIVNGLDNDDKYVRKKYKWFRKYFNHVLRDNKLPIIYGMTPEDSQIEYQRLRIKKVK